MTAPSASEEAASHPMRNRVFSCLGGSSEPQIELSDPVSLQDGDLIALCTDGTWSPLGDAWPPRWRARR
jgi:serine/threonine protein phosphatase PrpC